MSTPFFTVDTFASLFYTTALSPYFSSLFLLTLLARNAPLTSPLLLSSFVWLFSTIFLRLLYAIDARVEGGRSRQIDWAEEVVLITGGAGGLGGMIAQIYGMRGVSVAVVDIHGDEGDKQTLKSQNSKVSRPLREIEREWAGKGCMYFKCDVSNHAEVQSLKRRVEQALGPPTILINNAAVVHGKSFLDLRPDEVQRSLNVNVLSHYNTIQAFLPAMLTRADGGTIVTVSSVLGNLGCAALSDYTATKAAVTAMHQSLTAELSMMRSAKEDGSHPESIRTVLVTPGQLSTSLFESIKTPSSFFGPIVDFTALAKEIISKIDEGTSGELSVPLYARWIHIMHILPGGLKRIVRRLSGLDSAGWRASVAQKQRLK